MKKNEKKMKRIPKLQSKSHHKCTTIPIHQEKNEEVAWGRPWGCTIGEISSKNQILTP